ncbi:MAG: hypothetical protein KGQ60_01135 [Planctomycetes bacterium]|nr:hypothetical protein [Planctomycetota bacterium]
MTQRLAAGFSLIRTQYRSARTPYRIPVHRSIPRRPSDGEPARMEESFDRLRWSVQLAGREVLDLDPFYILVLDDCFVPR